MNVLLRILGIIVLIIGVALVYKPDLITSEPMPTDPYLSIEKRVKWGVVIGLGILLLFHHQLTPWLLTVSAFMFAITLGIVLARMFGIVLDGMVARQLLWLGIEVIVLLAFGFWYWKQRT